jgi:hypothetical protein
VRAYFRDGVLPKPGTICEIDDKLFNDATSSSIASRDVGLSPSLRALAKNMKIPRFGRFY